MNQPPRTVSLRRGLGGAILGGVLVTVLYGAAWTLYHSRALLSPDGFDRRYDLAIATHGIEFALLYCWSLGASAGFASFFPARRLKFAWALLLVLGVSLAAIVPTQVVLKTAGFEMRAKKAAGQPDLYPSEAITAIAAPALAATIIIAIGGISVKLRTT